MAMGTVKRALAAVTACALCGTASGEPVEIEVATPEFAYPVGVPVPLTATIRWDQGLNTTLARFHGSVVVTPAKGMGQNFESDFATGALVDLGEFDGASRVGMEGYGTPPFFVGGMNVPPWHNWFGITLAEYEIVGLQPGFYYARWVPVGSHQGVQVFASMTNPNLLELPTANISTRFFVGCCPGPVCPADMTATANPAHGRYGVPNGVLDNEDFFFFLARFAVGDRGVCDLTASATPGTPGYGSPNGVLNNDDFFYYLAEFAQGC